jgi:CubicO group peptidase (beta-lactamase class C family)
MCLDHSTGFSNFWFIEPDQKLHIHFEPGTRTSYSGEGFILLQFVIEYGRKAQGLGLDLGDLTQANFDRLGMSRTSLVWRDGFAANLAVAGTIRVNRRNMTDAARCAWRARWIPPFPTCRNSLPPWCAAMA